MTPRMAVPLLLATACMLCVASTLARGQEPAPPDSSRESAPGFVPVPYDTTQSPPDTASVSAPAQADSTQRLPEAATRADSTRRRLRVGLVLSGGGARGAAHIGILQVLEEHRIPVDCIAGASMGALVGGLYASGLSPVELDSVVTGLDWLDAFTDKIHRNDRTFVRKRDDDLFLMKPQAGLRGRSLLFPPGLLDTHRIDRLLERLSLPVATVRDFDQLGIPFRAVATDLVTGQAVVLDHGDLAEAIRASMSVPAAFSPREIEGRWLVDGGVIDDLPIDVARSMGADIIIAVDTSPALKQREDLNSLPAITYQVVVLASGQNRKRQIASLGGHDVYVRPDLGTMSLASFDEAAGAIAIGRQAAEAALPQLEPLALSDEDYRAYQQTRAARVPPTDSLDLAEVRIENRTRLEDDVLAHRLDVAPGPLDVGRLEHGLDRLYGLELFQSVGYDLRPAPRGDTLIVRPAPRSWGPNYLQAGIAVFDDYQYPSFNLALAYTRTAVNRLNGEWGLGVQAGRESGGWARFYQPLESRLRWFVDLKPTYIEWPISDYDADGHKRAEFDVTQYGGTLAGGREIASWGEVRAGLLRQGGNIRLRVGEPAQPSRAIDTGELFGQFSADELDGVSFPRRGFWLRARAAAGIEALGSAVSYQQLSADGFVTYSRERLTGLIGGILGVTVDSNAPIENQFHLGGLGRLSGLEQDERMGQQAMLLRAMVYRRISDLLPIYAGLTGEYGNTFHARADISFGNAILAGGVFLGAETPLGPVCAAYGMAEGGRYNFYLTLGQVIGGRRPSFRLQ